MRNPRAVFEVGSTILLVLCAVTVVAMQGSRFLGASRSPEVTPVEGWREKSKEGVWVGPQDADQIVTVFVDFTCPFCRDLSSTIDSLISVRGDDLSVVYHHYPLNRDMSLPGAVAAECAARQGRFAEALKPVYDAVQTAAGRAVDWGAVAAGAGIPDEDAFRACISLPPDSFPRIHAGKRIGVDSGVRGTPTIWVNGVPTVRRDFDALDDMLSETN